MATPDAIISKFESVMSEHSSSYSEWYVGITNNIERRLFEEHNVHEKGNWIHAEAINIDLARIIETYFLEKGCDGGSGGGDSDSTKVYAYLKTSQTKP